MFNDVTRRGTLTPTQSMIKKGSLDDKSNEPKTKITVFCVIQPQNPECRLFNELLSELLLELNPKMEIVRYDEL